MVQSVSVGGLSYIGSQRKTEWKIFPSLVACSASNIHLVALHMIFLPQNAQLYHVQDGRDFPGCHHVME